MNNLSSWDASLKDLAVFGPSDFAIINTERHSDFDIESRLSLRDQSNRKLHLSLKYVYVVSLREMSRSHLR